LPVDAVAVDVADVVAGTAGFGFGGDGFGGDGMSVLSAAASAVSARLIPSIVALPSIPRVLTSLK
jgi:hypothetical protein